MSLSQRQQLEARRDLAELMYEIGMFMSRHHELVKALVAGRTSSKVCAALICKWFEKGFRSSLAPTGQRPSQPRIQPHADLALVLQLHQGSIEYKIFDQGFERGKRLIAGFQGEDIQVRWLFHIR